MGLSGNKNRRKLAKDPNNTRWSRNEDSFGQKILRSQGWQPGQFLGVQDSAHSAHHTAANASYIRVTFRENNSGIGLKRAAANECTGLDAFQDLLGRLNGKDITTIHMEQKVREKQQVHLYVERKYGGMRFVKGGLLVGDKIKSLEDSVKENTPAESSQSEQQTATDPDRESQCDQPTDRKGRKDKKDKKDKNGNKLKKRKALDDTPEQEEDGPRKSKKKRVEPKASDDDMATSPESSNPSEVTGEEATRKKKKSKRSKEEKSARKASKKEKKKERKAKRDDDDDSDANSIAEARERKKEKKKRRRRDKEQSIETEETETTSTTQPSVSTSREPSASATATRQYQPVGARRLHRSKFIAAKRASAMDQTALNQIFMIKAAAGI